MLDLEDLPRLESLSPISDIDDSYSAETPGITIIPTAINNCNIGNGNMDSMAVSNIGCKTNATLFNSNNNINVDINSMAKGNKTEPMLIGGGLRYISQKYKVNIYNFIPRKETLIFSLKKKL